MPVSTRIVRIAPERLGGWISRFGSRHGIPAVEVDPHQVTCVCPDGAVAVIALRWGALPGTGDPLAELIESVLRQRTVGALLVRRKAHAVGVFTGSTLLDGRHDHHYVQGTTKAGGWSQQRYARRRGNQTAKAYAEAAADVEAVLVPAADRLEALVLGGDGTGVRAVLADFPALQELAERTAQPVYPVADPNRSVLAGFPDLFRAVPITLNELA
ncbi:MAG: acVLRF1 family peptidyl-tRNA hydrolase [Propionicimonas sp.]|nr:acVLRF1 family peptidyl-tRNA hydrolase [Propionicimonas sp.]